MVLMDEIKNSHLRRDFLKTTGAIGGALVAGFPAILSGAPAANALKVGLVGCGGRGTGAAAEALKADDYAELTAMADVFPEKIEASLAELRQASADKVKVEPSRQFVGLDAFEKVIASGVDVVILATPPGFRPIHLKAAVEAGKHIFCEKPASTDAPGVRSVLQSVKVAEQKNLSLVAGFCWRYSNYIQATFEQVRNGAIGDILAYYATYYTNPVKPMPPSSERPAGMSDIEWQVKNWYNFSWLCGDSVVEQAVHSVDKIAWAMGDKPPVSCVAVGGRQIPAEDGNIYDHFEVNYVYPNGIRAFLASRQIENCYNENSDYIIGTKGTCTIGRGPNPHITGEKGWTYQGAKNDMYQAEHDALFASIRQGKPINNGQRLASSTLLAIMGRMAAYTGQEVTWEEALNSQEVLFPARLEWNMTHPVPPMPRPGITKLI
jgi:myo-inositol 2-dehydrogenase/D-chiro-inositol 1-dehydrogenase